jgi:hypothetical protein
MVVIMMVMMVVIDIGGDDDHGRGTTHPLSSSLYLQEYPSSCLSSATASHTWQWKEPYYPIITLSSNVESKAGIKHLIISPD